jgi:hypothetical protein
MTAYDTLLNMAEQQSRRLRRRRDTVLGHSGHAMSVQEELAWDLLGQLARLDPTSFLFDRIRVGVELWNYFVGPDGLLRHWSEASVGPGEVAIVRVPVRRTWSPLWVVYTPAGLLLSKYRPQQAFCSIPYADPSLFDTLEKVLARLGLPVQLDP